MGYHKEKSLTKDEEVKVKNLKDLNFEEDKYLSIIIISMLYKLMISLREKLKAMIISLIK